MTTNRPIDKWGKFQADVPGATAILDRFYHTVTVFQILAEASAVRIIADYSVIRDGIIQNKKRDFYNRKFSIQISLFFKIRVH